MYKLALWSLLLGAFGPAAAAEPVVVFESPYDFATTRDNVAMSIEAQGLIISTTLHVSDMLTRTGKDLGYPEDVYQEAESLEFCSAVLSHQMIAIDPRNLVICPFTVAIYRTRAQPQQVYVAYRQQFLAGPAEQAVSAIDTLLRAIVEEAIE